MCVINMGGKYYTTFIDWKTFPHRRYLWTTRSNSVKTTWQMHSYDTLQEAQLVKELYYSQKKLAKTRKKIVVM